MDKVLRVPLTNRMRSDTAQINKVSWPEYDAVFAVLVSHLQQRILSPRAPSLPTPTETPEGLPANGVGSCYCTP